MHGVGLVSGQGLLRAGVWTPGSVRKPRGVTRSAAGSAITQAFIRKAERDPKPPRAAHCLVDRNSNASFVGCIVLVVLEAQAMAVGHALPREIACGGREQARWPAASRAGRTLSKMLTRCCPENMRILIDEGV